MRQTLSPIYLREEDSAGMTKQHKSGKLIAFGWYGGKFSHLKWLLPLLPSCHHYCEPFGGSAAVLLNRMESPVETYNDMDGEVVNFFRVLRNNPDSLMREIALTPFSREEFCLAVNSEGKARPALAWRRQPHWADGQTAGTPAGGACQESCRGGWAVLRDFQKSQKGFSESKLRIGQLWTSSGYMTHPKHCSIVIHLTFIVREGTRTPTDSKWKSMNMSL
jgi:DNA adenine methylase